MLVGYLSVADIVPGGQHPALVLPQMRAFYDEHGFSEFSAFKRFDRRAQAATPGI
jgi:hypothetical protein